MSRQKHKKSPTNQPLPEKVDYVLCDVGTQENKYLSLPRGTEKGFTGEVLIQLLLKR